MVEKRKRATSGRFTPQGGNAPLRNKKGRSPAPGRKRPDGPGRPSRGDMFQLGEPGLELATETIALSVAMERVGRALHSASAGASSSPTVAENFVAKRLAQLSPVDDLRRKYKPDELLAIRGRLVESFVRRVDTIIDAFGAARVHFARRTLRRRIAAAESTRGEEMLTDGDLPPLDIRIDDFSDSASINAARRDLDKWFTAVDRTGPADVPKRKRADRKIVAAIVAGTLGYRANEAIARQLIVKQIAPSRALALDDIAPEVLQAVPPRGGAPKRKWTRRHKRV